MSKNFFKQLYIHLLKIRDKAQLCTKNQWTHSKHQRHVIYVAGHSGHHRLVTLMVNASTLFIYSGCQKNSPEFIYGSLLVLTTYLVRCQGMCWSACPNKYLSEPGSCAWVLQDDYHHPCTKEIVYVLLQWLHVHRNHSNCNVARHKTLHMKL